MGEPAQQWGAPAQPAADQQLDRERVLEDLLHDVLRPMIRRWLDENLEGLVSRVLEEETATARRMRSSDETDVENFAAMVVSLMRRPRRPQ